jgi:hypothetical protein
MPEEKVMPPTSKTTIRTVALATGLAVALAGCGGEGYSSQTPPGNPAPQSATINGRYNLVLTAANGQAPTSTYIYTDFTQTETTLAAAAATLICPSNDPSQCVDASIAPTGTVNGANVTIPISYPDPAGGNIVTLVGSAQSGNLSGTYTDTLGRSGTWTASIAVWGFPTPPNGYDFIGTFNSTSDPLPIPLKISLQLVLAGTNLTGGATIMNSPCGVSLTLEGQSLGDAFSVTDTASKVRVIAVPTPPNSGNFTFSYKFEPAALSCASDSGRGELFIINQWDY